MIHIILLFEAYNGHLFQSRYNSMACDEDAYFLELVLYVHMNPFEIKAG